MSNARRQLLLRGRRNREILNKCLAPLLEARENLRRKLERVRIVPFDGRIADGGATLKVRLRARGRLKADIDLLIAATAIAEDAVLVTDDADLLGGDIPGLTAENWV